MAEVWEAVDLTLERRVAMKVVKESISSQPEFDARFRREARTAAQLEHPNILQIYSFGVEDGIAYIEMPCLSGGTLASRLESGPPPPPETVCEWVTDLAAALDTAHARGIIHRDIKSANVLFDQSGRIVLGDFGLAKSMADASGLTAAGTLMGTPMYLSPEQAKGETLTPRSDQFSLGVLAYRMLTGQLPWGPNTAPTLVMMRIVSHDPTPPSSLRPGLGAEVDAAFSRVLAKKPADRFETCDEFAQALRAALLPRSPTPPSEAPTLFESHPVPAAPSLLPAPGIRPHPVATPAPAAPARRSGLVVVLLLFLGVNSVVLALVLWDKIGARLPWVSPSETVVPAVVPPPVPSPTPEPEPAAEEIPVAVIEATPQPAANAVETEVPAAPSETPTPEPAPTLTPTPTPTAEPLQAAPASLPPGAIPPVRTSDVRPAFSDELMRKNPGLQGRVELEVQVEADGRVGPVRILRGVDPEVDAVVAEAARHQLAFTPATLRGRPIPARATVVVGVRFRVDAEPR